MTPAMRRDMALNKGHAWRCSHNYHLASYDYNGETHFNYHGIAVRSLDMISQL